MNVNSFSLDYHVALLIILDLECRYTIQRTLIVQALESVKNNNFPSKNNNKTVFSVKVTIKLRSNYLSTYIDFTIFLDA